MNIMTLVNALPGSVAQGLIWGILAIGVYITYKILDFADLTVDGSLGTGGAVAVVLIVNGCPVPLAIVCAFLAGCLAGLVTGLPFADLFSHYCPPYSMCPYLLR